MEIGVASLADADVRELLTLHQRRMFDASPPGTSFALDLAGLESADITIFSARRNGRLLGVAALRELGDSAAEIKSMRTADHALRGGVAQALLNHLATVARDRGLTRLLLETGTGPAFEAANALYRRNGFKRCGPFGAYAASNFNVFYERAA